MIYVGEGIIGNGGFQYFFENDFPGKRHRDFVRAYKLLGFPEHAKRILRLLSLFPLKRPQKDLSVRSEFMDTAFDGARNPEIDETDRFFWNQNDRVMLRIDEVCSDE